MTNTQSVGAGLIVWFASGLLAWTGASSFAELGSAIPVNGGAQAYLAYIYNPMVSYLFAWTTITAIKPGSSSVKALIFAEYINRLAYDVTTEGVPSGSLPPWSIKLVALLAVFAVAILCAATRNLSPRTAVVFTSINVRIDSLAVHLHLFTLMLNADCFSGVLDFAALICHSSNRI